LMCKLVYVNYQENLLLSNLQLMCKLVYVIFHTPWVTVSLIFDPELEPSNCINRSIIIPADLFFFIQ